MHPCWLSTCSRALKWMDWQDNAPGKRSWAGSTWTRYSTSRHRATHMLQEPIETTPKPQTNDINLWWRKYASLIQEIWMGIERSGSLTPTSESASSHQSSGGGNPPGRPVEASYAHGWPKSHTRTSGRKIDSSHKQSTLFDIGDTCWSSEFNPCSGCSLGEIAKHEEIPRNQERFSEKISNFNGACFASQKCRGCEKT